MGDNALVDGAAFPGDVPAGGRRLGQQDARRCAGFPETFRKRRDRRGIRRHDKLFPDRDILSDPLHSRIFRQLFAACGHQRFRPLLGEQTVAVQRIDRRGLDRHRSPVRAQFVGQDLRQHGIDPLPHFALRHDHRDLPLLRYFQIGTEYLLILGRGDIGFIAARPQRPGDHQTRHCAPSDQEVAAIQSGRRRFARWKVGFSRHGASSAAPGGEFRFSDSGP